MAKNEDDGLRILLIEPPHTSLFEVDAYHILPLGLLYVAAYLKERGHTVSTYNADTRTARVLGNFGGHQSEYDFKKYQRNVSDSRHTSWIKLRRILEQTEPDVVGISTPSLTSESVAKSCEIVRGYDEGIVLVAGGADATITPNEVLKRSPFDYVVRGEGEQTMADLADCILDEADPHKISGISFTEGGEPIHNPPRKQIADLDTIPFPARDTLLEPEHYSPTDMGRMVTGRGCPFSCNFCASGLVWGKTYRLRSPKNVVDEIEEVNRRWGTTEFNFLDDTFYHNDERVLKICDLMEKRGLDITWNCFLRGDRADPKVVARMKEAGLNYVNIGVESGSQEILDAMNKRLDIPALKRNVRLYKESGVYVFANYIIGYPGETKETLAQTRDLIRELATGYVVELFYPFPGTKAHDELRSSGMLLPVPLAEHNDYFRQIYRSDSIDPGYLNSEFKKLVTESYATWGRRIDDLHPGMSGDKG